MGTPPAVVVYVISVYLYLPERIQHPFETPLWLHTSPFRRCLCKYCHHLRHFCYTQDVDTTQNMVTIV